MCKGFTLVEFVVVIAVIAILAAATAPFYRSFYLAQQFESTADELVANLRRAQARAMASEQDSAWGVRWETGSYVIYAADDASYDEDVNYSDQVTISAVSDIEFNQLTGTTSDSGTITLTMSALDQSTSININAQGLINQE